MGDEQDDKVCLFDLDGTLVDYAGGLKRDLKLLASPGEPEVELKGPGQEGLPDYINQRIWAIRSQKGWWLSLGRIMAALRILHLARVMGYKIEILGKGPYQAEAWGEKVQWVRGNVSVEVDMNLVATKGRFYGRVLVDDSPEYMDNWLKHRPRGLGIMPTTSYNIFYTHPQVINYSPIMDYADKAWIDSYKAQGRDVDNFTDNTELKEKLQEAYDR